MLPDGLEPSTYSISGGHVWAVSTTSPMENGLDSAEQSPSLSQNRHADRNATVTGCSRCGATNPELFSWRVKRGKCVPQPYCKPCQVAYHREWRAGRGREKMRAANAASKARYPERNRARNTLANAIRRGEVVRGRCYVSGCAGRTEAHHDDYSRPLDVVWTCRTHHRALDRARRSQSHPARGRAA